MSGQLLRQDFIPMVAGFLIVMTALAIGLRITLRSAGPERECAGGECAGEPRRPPRRRWSRLAAQVAVTIVGGYLLLMLTDIGYYYGVAKVGGAFIQSAFTGGVMLIGLAVPVFAALSYLAERRRGRRSSS